MSQASTAAGERPARRRRGRHGALVLDAPALGVHGRAGDGGTAATTVWNAFANVVFAVAAVGLLAPVGESHALLTTTAVIGARGVAVAIALFAVALHDDGKARWVGGFAQRLWNRVAQLMRRRPASGWDERLVGFRREAVGLLRRRWLALTLATLRGHLTVFLVLLVALRAVGVASAEVSFAEAFAAWALIRIITTIPITPGGLGVVELGLTGALVSFGGRQAPWSPPCCSTACSPTCRRSRSAASACSSGGGSVF